MKNVSIPNPPKPAAQAAEKTNNLEVTLGTEPLSIAPDGTPEFVRRGTEQTELGATDNSKPARESRFRQFLDSLKSSDDPIVKKFYELGIEDCRKTTIAELTEKEATRYRDKTDTNIKTGTKFVLRSNTIRHEDNSGHLTGIRIRAEQKTGYWIDANPLTKTDISLLGQVLKSPNSIKDGHKGRNGQKLVIQKRINDKARVVVEIINEKDELEIVDYYKINKVPPKGNSTDSRITPQSETSARISTGLTRKANLPDNPIIPQLAPEVNVEPPKKSKIATVTSFVPLGASAARVEVEGDKSEGLPSFNLVGLASKTVCEARERVRSALKSSDFSFPKNRLTISLAPAELNKDGPHLDLPIAIAVLILSGQLRQEDAKNTVFIGELSLDGAIRPVRGIINLVEAAKNEGFNQIFLPEENLEAASLVEDVKLYGAKTLNQLFSHLKGQIRLPAGLKNSPKTPNTGLEPSNPLKPSTHTAFSDIKGQSRAKRALAIAIAGHHNILLEGPPGAGKTALSKAAVDLLPPLSTSEKIAVTKLHSLKEPGKIQLKPPFRAPHHTSSSTAIIGGGREIFPGEISLAHKGVLFLDELPEFPRNVLEALRGPLEDRNVTISRANLKVTYPADFMLIATMNPCPCGYLGDEKHLCKCTDAQVQSYQKKISGPLLDRIDLYVEVRRQSTKNLLNDENSAPETSIKSTIETALNRQKLRKTRNATLSTPEIRRHANLSHAAKKLLDTASEKLALSARSYLKTIRVARTIADLEDEDEILEEHISEALSFRKTEKL